MKVESWMDTCMITICKFAATSINIEAHGMTETIDISEPDYPGESIPNLAGGRAWKQSPQEDGEITLEFYPIQLDTASDHCGLFEQFVGGTYTSSEPRTTDFDAFTAGVSRARDVFAIAILWTNDNAGGSEIADAVSATAASTDGVRFVALGCRMISHKSSFTDGILKVTATFKFPAMNYDGDTMMFRWESADQTAIPILFTSGDYDDVDEYT